MKSLLTLFLLLWSMILFGQTNDSIVLYDSILEQSLQLRYQGKLDSALLYSKRLQAFPKSMIPEELRLKHITNFASLQSNLNKSIAILTKEQHYYESNKNYKNLAHILYAKGENYFDNFNDWDALINFIKADSLLQKINEDQWLAVMSKIGIVNVLMKSDYETDAEKFDKASLYINEGIKLADSIDFPVGNSILLEKKGHYLQLNNRLDESLAIYQRALEVSQSINYTLRESSIYDGIGKVFFKQKNIDSAAHYFEKHLNLIEKTAFSIDIAEANYNIGQFYNQVSKFQMAKSHLGKAWNIIEELPNVRKETPYNIQNELALTFSGLNEPKKALTSLIRAKELQAEVYNLHNSESIRELETRYHTEKKEQEIELLKSKNELAEQQKKSQRNFLLGGIGLTSLAGILLFVLYRNRQKTNKKLHELSALKSSFFTNISHEFRTPLTLISSPIQETLEEPDLSTDKRNHFEMASRNTKRLLSLVDQLLDLSKIESESRKLEIEKNKATQFISVWIESFDYLAKQKNITFDINIKDKNINVWFDKDALEKIVFNLLGNAIKYTPNAGHIKVNASAKDTIQFKVENTGKGLTVEQKNNIFNRFYQISEENYGTGIGLSLVKELVELYKGKITVKSGEDKWTSFAVSLPTKKAKFKNAVLKKSITTVQDISLPILSNLSNQKEKELLLNDSLPILLIVEDNADVRSLLYDTFKTKFNVIKAVNGEEGIKKAFEIIPDIIVSDVMMPIKDGTELTKTLKKDERTSHIPIVLLTAKAGDENKLVGFEVGADDYITKPFNQTILKTKVDNLISLRKKLQSRYSQEVILKPKDISINSVDEHFLEKVQQVLDEQLREPSFTVTTFSKTVSMSRMQLHRKLKALTGLSSSEFIRSQRLKLAAQILRQSDINISEVGYSVGFNDHAYFSKCFKEAYNCTPSEFIQTK